MSTPEQRAARAGNSPGGNSAVGPPRTPWWGPLRRHPATTEAPRPAAHPYQFGPMLAIESAAAFERVPTICRRRHAAARAPGAVVPGSYQHQSTPAVGWTFRDQAHGAQHRDKVLSARQTRSRPYKRKCSTRSRVIKSSDVGASGIGVHRGEPTPGAPTRRRHAARGSPNSQICKLVGDIGLQRLSRRDVALTVRWFPGLHLGEAPPIERARLPGIEP